jgi:hypothetical protein
VTAAALIAVAVLAEPSTIRLGKDARATLRVEAAAEAPALLTSVGRIENVRAAGAGSWIADYFPPDAELPQVAIVTAVVRGEIGWTAIPLWGQGDAVVKTRPRGNISVEIAGKTFGPVVADAAGQAQIPVEVPPGVREASQGKRIIPLNVPASRTVHLAIGDSARASDRPQTVPVFAVAVTAGGQPRAGAALKLRTDRGTLTPPRERAPGLYEASLSLPPGPPGKVRITAVLEGEPRFVAEASLLLRGGPAERIAISADRDRIGADDPQARLHVVARDAAGNVSSDDLAFETTAGRLATVATAPGEWNVTVSLEPSFAGRKEIEVRARAPGSSAAQKLPLVPGSAEVITFDDPAPVLIADGSSRHRLQVELQDRYGNPIPDARPEVSVDQGHAELEDAGGALYATYVPPLLERRGNAVLSLRAGTVEGHALVTLVPRGSLALSPKLGFLSNFSGFSAPLFGVEASYRTDRLGPQLGLAIEADYAHREQSDLVFAGGSTVSARSRLDLMLLHFSATFRQAIGDQSTIWLAAGPSAAAYWTRVNAGDAPERRGFAIAPGLQCAVGAERRIGIAIPFVEARAGWINSPGLPMLTGPLRTVTLMLGVRFEGR